MKMASRAYVWTLGFIWLVASGYSAWISFVFRNPDQTFPHPFMMCVMTLFVICLFFSCFPRALSHERRLSFVSMLMVIVALALTFIVTPATGNLLVVVPERGGIREAYVIETMGVLERPFSDKIIAIRLSYAVEADITINTDDGAKFITRSHKKEFRVIDPIAVYHWIGAKDEVIEAYLRDKIIGCFHQEIGGREFSYRLVKKAGEPFFIQSCVCELGLKFYGLEPVGEKMLSFSDFRMANILPIRLQVE